MATSTHFTIHGLDKLTMGLAALGRMKEVMAAIRAGATHLKGMLDDYPPRRRISQN